MPDPFAALPNVTARDPRPSTPDVLLRSSLEAYPGLEGRAALRCGLGDAASLCDSIARQVVEEHRGRGGRGRTTKLGHELAAVATRCGDEIWAHRGRVGMPTDDQQRAAEAEIEAIVAAARAALGTLLAGKIEGECGRAQAALDRALDALDMFADNLSVQEVAGNMSFDFG